MKFNQYSLQLIIFFISVFIMNRLQVLLCRKILCKSVLKNSKEVFTPKFNRTLYAICVFSDIACLLFVILYSISLEYGYEYAANISFLDMFYMTLLEYTGAGIFTRHYITIILSLVVNFVLGTLVFSRYRDLELKSIFWAAFIFSLIVAPYYYLIPFGMVL